MKPFLLTCLLVLFFGTACYSQQIDKEILLNDLKQLSSEKFEGRGAGTPGGHKAAAYIIDRFKESQLHPLNGTYSQKFPLKGNKTGINLLGVVAGRSPKVIVISAHYDHLGLKNGTVYHGADDNASGTSALIALAAYFAINQPNYTMLFAAFDAEESGLLGSKYFIQHTPLAVENIILNINMDMIGRNDKHELYVAGTTPYPELKPFIKSATENLHVKTGHDSGIGFNNWINQSDQAVFHKKKIPFLYFGVEDHEDYHKPTDTYERIQPDFFYAAAQRILETILAIDSNYRLPNNN